MPPSSLIFVVILAVWGAYLVQHWVRRRDHIATARSVDRFSESMRVLERRQHLPQTDLSRPVPRSYAVSPIRPASPEVVVKHAMPTPAAPSRVTAARVAAGAAAGRAVAGGAGVGRAARSGARAAASPLSSIRGRSAMLLVGTVAMVLGTGLGVLELWPWWTAAAGIGAFALSALLVRRSVRRATPAARSGRRSAQRAGRRSAERAGRTPGRRPGRTPAAPAAGGQGQRVVTRPVPGTLSRPAARHAGRPGQLTPGQLTPGQLTPGQPTPGQPAPGQSAGLAVDRPQRAGTRTAATAAGGAAAALAARTSAGRPATSVPRRQAASAVYDIDLVEGRTGQETPPTSAPRRREGPAEAGSWDPVPVPPPTYTLKAKAAPRHTDPAGAPPAAASTAVPATDAGSPSGLPDLPFDGLALAFDEESEELPAVRTQH